MDKREAKEKGMSLPIWGFSEHTECNTSGFLHVFSGMEPSAPLAVAIFFIPALKHGS